MPLFEVELIYTAVVAAKDRDDAEKATSKEAFSIVSDDSYPDICVVKQINSKEELPPGYDLDSYAYGDLGTHKSIKELLDEEPATQVTDPAQTNIDFQETKT